MASLTSFAQGLEGIIVEKYYVSDENDTSVNDDGGVLPVGSKTYRVYVDMLPNYIFQAAYGETGHELRIATTTRFFNNEDRGETFPDFGENRLEDNTVMLDSWLSVGGACDDCIGVLKMMDDGENTIVNADGVLINADTCAGIPLTQQDGYIPGAPETVTTIGISSDIEIFNSSNDSPIPTVFSTENGAWSSLTGSMGPDSMENIVLIGQFTTDGTFSFELNIQIRNEETIVVENYVARNPVGDEIFEPTLIFSDSMMVDDSTTSVIYLAGFDDEVKLFPNPTSSELNISTDLNLTDRGNYEIISLTGKQMLFQELDPVNYEDMLSNIRINHLAEGIYILKLTIDGDSYTRKFVKH